MSEMIAQLQEIAIMQHNLDIEIMKKHGITEYPLEEVKMAVIDEIGELTHELKPQWCYWKTKKGEASRQRVLEEYVDILHFKLSLFMAYGTQINPRFHEYKEQKNYTTLTDNFSKLTRLHGNEMGLCVLFQLGNQLGFTWNEIYDEYKRKNAINHQRQEEGY